jgi:hypothetical protein
MNFGKTAPGYKTKAAPGRRTPRREANNKELTHGLAV